MPEDKIKIESLTAAPLSASAAETPPETVKKSIKFDLGGLFKKRNKTGGSFDVFKFIKFIYPLTIFVIVLILIWVMSFLYNNVYLTMSQAEFVSNLKSKVIEESVNFNKFNDTIEKITVKNNLSQWPYLNYLASPFDYGVKTPYPTGAIPATIIVPTSTQPIIPTSTTATSTKKTTST